MMYQLICQINYTNVFIEKYCLITLPVHMLDQIFRRIHWQKLPVCLITHTNVSIYRNSVNIIQPKAILSYTSSCRHILHTPMTSIHQSERKTDKRIYRNTVSPKTIPQNVLVVMIPTSSTYYNVLGLEYQRQPTKTGDLQCMWPRPGRSFIGYICHFQ